MIALPAFLVNQMNTFDHCSLCEEEAVRSLAYLLRDDAKEGLETYAANKMSADDHVYHGTSSVITNDP